MHVKVCITVAYGSSSCPLFLPFVPGALIFWLSDISLHGFCNIIRVVVLQQQAFFLDSGLQSILDDHPPAQAARLVGKEEGRLGSI